MIPQSNGDTPPAPSTDDTHRFPTYEATESHDDTRVVISYMALFKLWRQPVIRIIGIPSGQLPTLEERRREASVRELRRVMADETHPCQQFLEPGRRTTYQLRRQTSSYKIPLSRTERHRQSFIPRSLNILQQ
ncbi:tripeptidyl-peptidase II Tpp2 [Branchiostoma belcheri]|nr:tripeptidyl-peptidase II Tpp2 [Branchiostoma belcheri]